MKKILVIVLVGVFFLTIFLFDCALKYNAYNVNSILLVMLGLTIIVLVLSLYKLHRIIRSNKTNVDKGKIEIYKK